MSLLLVCLSARAQTAIPPRVSIGILGFDTYNGVAIACKHNPTGRFRATHEFNPDPRVETIISLPVLKWTISPATDVSLNPPAGTDTATVDVKMENDAAYGKEYSVTVTATWKVRMTATGEKRNVEAKATVKLAALKVELMRKVPNNPCLIGTGRDYTCSVYPSSIKVNNYAWSSIPHCSTATTDPYQCPTSTGHLLIEFGPDGADKFQWKSNLLGPWWQHAGEHEVKCKTTIGGNNSTSGHECTGALSQEVQPLIEITNVGIISPAGQDGTSWEYDPFWNDTNPAIAAGEKKSLTDVPTATMDVDYAKVKYALNKDALECVIYIYKKNNYGDDKQVDDNPGATTRGDNIEVAWAIDNEDVGRYYAAVTAQGPCGKNDRWGEGSPAGYEIVREDYVQITEVPHHNVEFAAGEYTPAQMQFMGETVEATIGAAMALIPGPQQVPKVITVLGGAATGVGTGMGVWALMDPLTQGMVTGSKLWYTKWNSIHKKWSGSAYTDGEYGGFHWQADHFTTAHGLSWPDEFDGARQVPMFRIYSDPYESHMQGPIYEHRVYGYWWGVTGKFEKIEAGDLWHANFDPFGKILDGVYIGVRE